ncbi:unnamed protein product, partial [Amoebophrya sp. A25]
YEVRVCVGQKKGGGFKFEGKQIPVKTGPHTSAHSTEHNSWQFVPSSEQAAYAATGSDSNPLPLVLPHLKKTEPRDLLAKWSEKEDTNLGKYDFMLDGGKKSLRTDIRMDYTVAKKKDEPDDLMSQLQDAKGMCCGGDTVDVGGKPEEQYSHETLAFYQRVYCEEAKYAPHTCATSIGIGKQPIVPKFDRKVAGAGAQEERDTKDLDNVDNPWYRDPTFDQKYCRRVLHLPIPEKLSLLDADGKKILAPLNHVNKIVLRGAGTCSRGQSQVFLVLRQSSRSLKLFFDVAGDSYYVKSLLAKLKDNPTPGQQAIERTVTGLMNELWETTRALGGQPITDQFVSIEKWKISPGNFFSGAKLSVVVDVDLDKSGFVEQGTEAQYDQKTKDLVAHVSKAFAEDK